VLPFFLLKGCFVARLNIGKHLIISEEVHTSFRAECAKAGVRMTDVADTIIKDYLEGLTKADDETRAAFLKKLAEQRIRPKHESVRIEVPTLENPPIQEDSNVAPQEVSREGQAKPQ
jgi:hypothetical protein